MGQFPKELTLSLRDNAPAERGPQRDNAHLYLHTAAVDNFHTRYDIIKTQSHSFAVVYKHTHECKM